MQKSQTDPSLASAQWDLQHRLGHGASLTSLRAARPANHSCGSARKEATRGGGSGSPRGGSASCFSLPAIRASPRAWACLPRGDSAGRSSLPAVWVGSRACACFPRGE